MKNTGIKQVPAEDVTSADKLTYSKRYRLKKKYGKGRAVCDALMVEIATLEEGGFIDEEEKIQACVNLIAVSSLFEGLAKKTRSKVMRDKHKTVLEYLQKRGL